MPSTDQPPPSADDRVTGYALAVQAGVIVAGPHVRAACTRHLDDLVHAIERGYTFSYARAQHAFDFFSKILRLNAGEFEGLPFELQSWQAFILGSIFGWIDADGYRRFRTAFIEAGKGSGKSPMAAGIGLYLMVGDKEARAEIYAAASKKDQAMILYRDAVAMVQQSPSLTRHVRVVGGVSPWNMIFQDSFFKPISSDEGQSGPRPHGSLVDEVHEHKDDVVIEMLRAGFKFRRQPMMLLITNSGVDRQSVCWRYHQHAVNVADRMLADDRFFSYVCAVDKTDEPMDDESCWIKANPNLGVSIRPDYIRDQVTDARAMPAKESLVRRLNFCQWTDASSPWISGEAWRACEFEAPADVLARFEGRSCMLAVDLSTTTDLTALAIATDQTDVEGRPFEPDAQQPREVDPDGEPAEQLPMIEAAVEFWAPGEGVAAREIRDAVPYQLWAREGYLNLSAGPTVDYDHLARRIKHIAERIYIRALVFDRYRMPYLKKALEDAGVELQLIEHPQGWIKIQPKDDHTGIERPVLWMPQSINEIERAILRRRLYILRNPILTWCAASAVCNIDDQGSRIFNKRKSTGRIDGLVALTMDIGALRAPNMVVDVDAMIAAP